MPPHAPKKSSLRKLLFAILAVVTLGMAMTLATMWRQAEEALNRKTAVMVLSKTQALSRELDNVLALTRQCLSLFAQSREMSAFLRAPATTPEALAEKNAKSAALAPRLRSTVALIPHCDDIALLDLHGSVLASAVTHSPVARLGKHAILPQASQGRLILPEPAPAQSHEEKPVFLLIQPIGTPGATPAFSSPPEVEQDAIIGAFAASINLAYLADTLLAPAVSPGFHVYVVARDGTVIMRQAQSRLPAELVGESVANEPWFQQMETGNAKNDNTETLRAVVSLEQAEWMVVGEIDRRIQINPELMRLMLPVLLVGFLTLLIVALVAFVLLRGVTRDLARGVQFAEQVAGGNLGSELNLNRHDELGAMADALNAMVRALKKQMQSLEIELQRNNVLAQAADDIIFEYDFHTDIIRYFGKYTDLFGSFSVVPDFLAKSIERGVLHPDDVSIVRKMVAHILQGAESGRFEVRFRPLEGNYQWYSLCCGPIRNHRGELIKIVGRISCIQNQKEKEEALRFQSQIDGLTMLFNKTASEGMAKAILERSPDTPAALMIIDIDDFKSANDTLGHAYGDEVLTAVASMIRTSFHSTDLCGRIGGDEFLVLDMGISSRRVLEARLEQFYERLKHMPAINRPEYSVSLCVGVALSPSDGTDYDQLFRQADKALYRAKHAEKGRWAFAGDGEDGEVQGR